MNKCIERLQAIKEIASNACIDKKDIMNICDLCDIIAGEIPDIENIVAELENEIEWHSTHGVNRKIINAIIGATTRAINIVKKGGQG